MPDSFIENCKCNFRNSELRDDDGLCMYCGKRLPLAPVKKEYNYLVCFEEFYEDGTQIKKDIIFALHSEMGERHIKELKRILKERVEGIKTIALTGFFLLVD